MRRLKSNKEVDINQVKKELIALVTDKFGSVNNFTKSDEAKSLEIEKSVKTILFSDKMSLPVINRLRVYFSLKEIKSETIIKKESVYTIND